jgi:hypothetical protein
MSISMSKRNQFLSSSRPVRLPRNVVSHKRFRHGSALSQRARGLEKNEQSAFAPPERWYEPDETPATADGGYRIVVQPPGEGYRHVLTPKQIRQRLRELPAAMLSPLKLIQLSQMTRKKQSFPCYGMQWGTTLYLYPIEQSLIEYYGRPPKPSQMTEAKMYGGRWVNEGGDSWSLVWTEAAIRDYYLNNILIHELGHLLDERNRSYTDRERYAEWFAIEHGYRHTSRHDKRAVDRKEPKRVIRRHHGS